MTDTAPHKDEVEAMVARIEEFLRPPPHIIPSAGTDIALLSKAAAMLTRLSASPSRGGVLEAAGKMFDQLGALTKHQFNFDGRLSLDSDGNDTFIAHAPLEAIMRAFRDAIASPQGGSEAVTDIRAEAERRVIEVRGSSDVPGFEACVQAEADTIKREAVTDELNPRTNPIKQMRELLRIALSDLAALESFCDPALGFQPQNIAVENAQEALIESLPEDVVGRCEECRCIILVGDKGHVCLDGEPIFCKEHAWTWREVQESREGGDEEDKAEFAKSLAGHLAKGGSLDDKMFNL